MHRTLIVITGLALMLAACEEDVTAPPPNAFENVAFVTTTDFATGSASSVALNGLVPFENLEPIHSDAVARFFDGYVYVVNRQNGDNIQVLDPRRGFATDEQFSVGNGSDPHDFIWIRSNKGYVSRYNETTLWIVDPVRGDQTGVVDLSGLADGDGIPEMDRMALIGDRVYLSIQRVDRTTDWGPVGESYIAVIDASTDELVDTDLGAPGTQPILLTGTNPYTELRVNPFTGALCVGVVGDWGVRDHGLESVDPVSLQSNGIILDESDVHGDITDLAFTGASTGFVIVTDTNFNNLLLSFDVSGASAAIDTVYAPGSFALSDMEIAPGNRLFVADRSVLAPGIRVFNATTGAAITPAPIDVGLPPFDIEMVVE